MAFPLRSSRQWPGFLHQTAFTVEGYLRFIFTWLFLVSNFLIFMKTIIHAWRVMVTLVFSQATILCLLFSSVQGAESSPRPARHMFADDVAKLAAAPAPAPGGILMVGSSIFGRWHSCTNDLAPLPVLNRAFGGSVVGDQLFFFDQIVPSSRAALIVWYCGSNDVYSKQTPEDIVKNTGKWIKRARAALPQVRILLVSVMRAPQKREVGLLAKVDEVNKGLIQLAASIPDVTYADVNPAMETADGEPVMACYIQDKLHPTPEGYRRMASVLRPLMEKEWKTTATDSLPANEVESVREHGTSIK
jgi:lysophospholipase L1-like esterase